MRMGWLDISQCISEVARTLSDSNVPVVLHLPGRRPLRMIVTDVHIAPTAGVGAPNAVGGLALLVELCDPDGRTSRKTLGVSSENFSEKSPKVLDTEGGDMIQYGAEA